MEQKELRQYAENILKDFNYEYVGYSDTNGQSMYFDIDGVKVRFSDHSVINKDRMSNEVHFSLNRIGSDSSNFAVEQSLLQLRYRLGDKNIKYGKRQMLMPSGKYLKGFGYSQNQNFGKGGSVTYKDKYNTKYGYKKNESHTLEEISKDTGVSMKGLQQIYNKGIGAYKTNPSSVRPNVKSKEQWAMARVYSAVMGGKTARIDAKELKMEKGGMAYIGEPMEFYERTYADGTKEIYSIEDYEKNIYPLIEKKNKMEKGGLNWYAKGGIKERFAEGGQITQYEIESMRNYINSPRPNPKLKESFEKVLRKYGVEPQTGDLSNFPQGKYINPYDFSGYEYIRKKNEEAGVFFLLTGEYELVSKAIYEKDYSMWLFYSYLGRINISFSACQNWLTQAQEYFEQVMPVPIWLVHTPRAKDGRSYAGWMAVSEGQKTQAESRIGRPLIFEYNGMYYYNEIGMVGNYDNNNDGWGTLYREKKTGLLIPEYTETSFHFNTLIHEFAHCLDFQSQLIQNIEKFKLKSESKEQYVNTESMSDSELALYAKQLENESKKGEQVTRPITNHFTEFVDSLIRVLRACASGNIPLTQLYEQQALDVQQALAGKYGDLLLAQREKRALEAKELAKEDELRDNKRFSWQSSWVNDVKEYAIEYAIQIDLKSKLKTSSKQPLTLTEAIELDNLITGYFNTDFKKYMLKNPSKATQRLEDIKALKKETNRIINNHYDNVKSNYQFGFNPSNELEVYIKDNCDIRDFRDYKSWKECAKEKLQAFQ